MVQAAGKVTTQLVGRDRAVAGGGKAGVAPGAGLAPAKQAVGCKIGGGAGGGFVRPRDP